MIDNFSMAYKFSKACANDKKADCIIHYPLSIRYLPISARAAAAEIAAAAESAPTAAAAG